MYFKCVWVNSINKAYYECKLILQYIRFDIAGIKHGYAPLNVIFLVNIKAQSVKSKTCELLFVILDSLALRSI